MKQAMILAIILMPAVLGLQFLTPVDGTTYTGDTLVNFTWDSNPVNFSINGAAATETNETNASVLLSTGTHTATITNSNETANVTVVVQQPAQQVITVTTDQPVYEVGTSARIRVTVTTPAQLTLAVQRDGTTVDAYTINVQQQTDFLYATTTVGNYAAIATGQGATASTSFTVQNTTISVVISGASAASVGRIASYTSTVSGGAAPYSYQWLFSDNTTSSGPTADHVFNQNGTYNITLLVTDSTGKQATATKQVSVTELTYSLDVTVMGDNNKLLRNAVVVLSDSRGGRTQTTNSFGEATFTNLSVGNYTVNTTYNDTRQTPGQMYTDTRSLQLADDENLLIRLAVPDQLNVANNTSSTQNAANAASTANTAAQTIGQAAAAQTLQETTLQTVAEPEISLEEQARLDFEQERSEKLNELRSVKSVMARSDEKQAILTMLGLSSQYDIAQQRIERAATTEEIDSALSAITKEIAVLTKDTTTTKLTEKEIEQLALDYFLARSIPNEERKKYLYNIQEVSKQTTITTTRAVVKVTSYDGTSTLYTIYSRSIAVPEASSFIEFIPKDIAADAHELRVYGSYEVLESDPVIRFLSAEYSYAVEKETTKTPLVLPVPLELVEPPSIIGLVAVKLKLTSFDRGALYLVILGIVLGVVIIGNVHLRRDTQSSLPEFIKLTELTLSTAEQGNYKIVAKYEKELKAIHVSLSPEEQAHTADIMTFITDAAAVHSFRIAAAHVQTTISLNDTTAVAEAYERAMQHYEALSEYFQAQEKQLLEEINNALEQHLTTQETQ